MAGWMNERWPMSLLLPAIRWELANSLDIITPTGFGYPRFASELCIGGRSIYTAQDIELIRVRNQTGSITYALLLDFEARGGSIQAVQRALENIGHVAADIIPAYIGAGAQIIPDSGQYTGFNTAHPRSFNNGHQNTEPPRCKCRECQVQYSNYPGGLSSDPLERSSLNGSIYTGGSGHGRRISKRRGGTQSGSAAAGTGGRSDVTSSANSSITYTEQGIPVSRPLPNMNEGYNGEQNPSARGINGETNNQPCICEECRLRSDSDQTQRLTLESDPKTPCMLRLGHRKSANREYGYNSSRASEDISSRLSQLYLDSRESGETSMESVENSDETFVKSVINESLNVVREANPASRDCRPILTSNRRPICSRSDMGKHSLGDMVNNCPVCINHAGAKPKIGSRPRNNSAPEKKNEIPDTDLRKSWHGTPDKYRKEEMRKISSDSALLVPQSSIANIPPAHGSNSIDEIIYWRMSCISSENSVSRAYESGPGSIDSSTMENNSVPDIYQNNLESGNSNVLTNQPIDSRNIVQSDSSNCSELQNRVPVNSLLHSRASVDPQIQISNDRAQRGNSISEDAQERGKSATNAQQNGGSAATARLRREYVSNAEQRRGSVTSAQQSRGSATSAVHRSGSMASSQHSTGSAPSARQNSGSTGGAPQGSGSTASAQRNQDGRSGDFVFVTYSWNGMTDPESLIQEIIEMCCALREAGIRVKIDMDEASYNALRLNRLDWIDRNVREARYVIVCVSPTYASDIIEPDTRNQVSPRSGQLNARYIFDKLREEYYSNSSQNRRIIPVMFSNYRTNKEHVPSCMRSTLVYSYPINVEEIIAAILGYGRFNPS